jgi:hypothetical protein
MLGLGPMGRVLFDHQHLIDGAYTLHDGELVYRTQEPQHMYSAVNAMRAKREFKLAAFEPAVEFAGTVKSARRMPGAMPPTWEIVIVLSPTSPAQPLGKKPPATSESPATPTRIQAGLGQPLRATMVS